MSDPTRILEQGGTDADAVLKRALLRAARAHTPPPEAFAACDGKAKGAKVILCSMVPHEKWEGTKISRGERDSFVKWTKDAANASGAGFINLNEIVMGAFRSAYLGYYGMLSFARTGLMTETLRATVNYAFNDLGLHRLEANIQPDNLASIALVRRVGFKQEGFSPRYLRINGEWRDHERWAMLADTAD